MPPRSAKKNTVTSATKKLAVKSPPGKTKPHKAETENTTEPTAAEDPQVKVAVTGDGEAVEGQVEAKKAEEAGDATVDAAESNGAEAEKGEKDNKDERLELDDNEPYEEDTEEPLKDEAAVKDSNKNSLGDGTEEEAEDQVGEDDDNGDEEEGNDQEGEDDEGVEEEEEGEGEDVQGEGDEEDGGGEGDDDHQEIDMAAPRKDKQRQKEFEIFVGGLDKEANEEDLKKVFSEVGEVIEVRMKKNPTTQKNKGFAFIRFATVEQAKRALTELKNPQVREKRCGVSPSQDNDTLYLGNICKTWTKDAVRDKLKEYGIENIEEMALADDPKNEGNNRGFALLEFTTHLDAMNAYKRLQKRDSVFGCDRSAKVAFAETSIQPDEEVMAQVKTVFVDGLTDSWDEDRVKEEFKKYGEIEKVQLSRNMSSARRKDYGFVTFTSHDNALACVEGINNSDLGEGDNKVKANIAKPQHKGRLVKQGVRGGYRIGKGGKAVRGRGSSRPQSKGKGGRTGQSNAGRGGRIRGRGPKRNAGGNKDSDKVKDKHLPAPEKAHDKPTPAQPKSKSKRDRGRRNGPRYDIKVRSLSQSALDFTTHAVGSRRSYRDSYAERTPKALSRSVTRRLPYPQDSYSRHLDRIPNYPDGHTRPYDLLAGSKRPYSALDDVPRYADPALRHPRARLDYDTSAGASLYGQSTRLGRGPQAGYSGRLYDSHPSGAGYAGSSLSGTGVGGMYSSGYGTDSLSGRTDIGGSSYSSLYSSRSSGGGYLPSRGSGSYY
eukprot:Gb_21243 [translate_table: standard]